MPKKKTYIQWDPTETVQDLIDRCERSGKKVFDAPYGVFKLTMTTEDDGVEVTLAARGRSPR